MDLLFKYFVKYNSKAKKYLRTTAVIIKYAPNLSWFIYFFSELSTCREFHSYSYPASYRSK